jgi:hypothetical protein
MFEGVGPRLQVAAVATDQVDGDGVMADSLTAHALRSPIHYDAVRRRLWICGQRCHHGATGALLTAVAAAGLVGSLVRPRGALTLAATGSLLMAHDWKDRPLWFERGPGSQP